MSVERARRDLAAARLLLERGFFDRAVSSAYYAAFHAATTALLAVGESRKTHSGLVTAFGKEVVVEGGLEPKYGRALNVLLDLRATADYAQEEASPEIARRAVADAEQFVGAVESWLAERGSQGRDPQNP